MLCSGSAHQGETTALVVASFSAVYSVYPSRSNLVNACHHVYISGKWTSIYCDTHSQLSQAPSVVGQYAGIFVRYLRIIYRLSLYADLGSSLLFIYFGFSLVKSSTSSPQGCHAKLTPFRAGPPMQFTLAADFPGLIYEVTLERK